MRKFWHAAVVATLALAGAAGAEAAKNAAKTDTTAKADMKADQKSGVVLPADEKAFFEWLHHANQAEIQVGELAQQKATNKDVKAYGEMLVKHHREADEKVMAFAKEKGWALGDWKPNTDADKRMQEAEKADMDKLKALDGEMFERTFLANMVGDHDTVLAMVGAAKTKWTDTAKLLGPMGPELTMHRDHAYKLLGELKARAS